MPPADSQAMQRLPNASCSAVRRRCRALRQRHPRLSLRNRRDAVGVALLAQGGGQRVRRRPRGGIGWISGELKRHIHDWSPQRFKLKRFFHCVRHEPMVQPLPTWFGFLVRRDVVGKVQGEKVGAGETALRHFAMVLRAMRAPNNQVLGTNAGRAKVSPWPLDIDKAGVPHSDLVRSIFSDLPQPWPPWAAQCRPAFR